MSKAELYNQVLDEPNMLECILQHMRDPADIVHLSLCGKSNLTRFHNTIETVLLEKHEDLIEKKMDKFAGEVAVCVDQFFSANHTLTASRAIGKLFDFLHDNHMWYKEGIQLHSFDRIVERKLAEFALDARYSRNALKSLSMLFDISERCLMYHGNERCMMLDGDDLVEYMDNSEVYN
jgi:hypothetical protein